ncbi:hypothetical protein F9288_08860 [Sphingomonas sp. CL5.1]|nr:hypothetical protein [Sphingomonas sp. CL5.1]QKR98209.1 hypothetical protein F9288_08860 [Sphingomonas sp. CL5.1]
MAVSSTDPAAQCEDAVTAFLPAKGSAIVRIRKDIVLGHAVEQHELHIAAECRNELFGKASGDDAPIGDKQRTRYANSA